jgi:pyridoxine kinase
LQGKIPRKETHLSVVHAKCISTLPGYFVGVGDLFSALLLGHYHASSPGSQMPLAYATSMALKKTYGIIRLTHDHWKSLPEDVRQDTDDEKDAVEP